MWSFIGNKENTVYIWLSIYRYTREIVGCFIGERTRKSARQLWASLPGVYRQCAVAYTDFWQSYETVIPANRHRAVGKETGQTNHMERLNNTFRQRLSRLVRKSLSFSKKRDNQGASQFCKNATLLILHSSRHNEPAKFAGRSHTSIVPPFSSVAGQFA